MQKLLIWEKDLKERDLETEEGTKTRMQLMIPKNRVPEV